MSDDVFKFTSKIEEIDQNIETGKEEVIRSSEIKTEDELVDEVVKYIEEEEPEEEIEEELEEETEEEEEEIEEEEEVEESEEEEKVPASLKSELEALKRENAELKALAKQFEQFMNLIMQPPQETKKPEKIEFNVEKFFDGLDVTDPDVAQTIKKVKEAINNINQAYEAKLRALEEELAAIKQQQTAFMSKQQFQALYAKAEREVNNRLNREGLPTAVKQYALQVLDGLRHLAESGDLGPGLLSQLNTPDKLAEMAISTAMGFYNDIVKELKQKRRKERKQKMPPTGVGKRGAAKKEEPPQTLEEAKRRIKEQLKKIGL